MLRYTKELLASRVLDTAKNSASFYVIMDNLQEKNLGETLTLTLDPESSKQIQVMLKKTRLGTLKPMITPVGKANHWQYFIDDMLVLDPPQEDCVTVG